MAKKVITKKKPTKKVAIATPNKKSTKKVAKAVYKTAAAKLSELRELDCRECGSPAKKPLSVVTYVCWQCVHEMAGDQELPKTKQPSGFPRGWAFMKEFVHVNGSVYHKGKEQLKLKGTLKPTTIKAKAPPKVKKSKVQRAREKQEALVEFSNLKKQIKKEKRVTYRRKLETQLRKLQKKL
tara:strand:- start:2983 stop:3525 length:543 start_codon:yes stop_codon:yes gene_type:complete